MTDNIKNPYHIVKLSPRRFAVFSSEESSNAVQQLTVRRTGCLATEKRWAEVSPARRPLNVFDDWSTANLWTLLASIRRLFGPDHAPEFELSAEQEAFMAYCYDNRNMSGKALKVPWPIYDAASKSLYQF